MKTLIIAEAGVNHNGDLSLARDMIDVAARAGADMVKFQTFSVDHLVTRSAQKAVYQQQTTSSSESQYEMLRRLELGRESHDVLIQYCQKQEIQFFSTGFDIRSIDYLQEIGLQRFKIPSGEITNLPYLRHIGRLGKPIILSTGMSDIGEIEAALDVLERTGTTRDRITVLHCNTAYPTPMVDVNLRAMLTIRDRLGVAVGYSDHTLGIEVSIAAVALGATVIEKHFTLDRNLPGPDQKASLEPDEFVSLVSAIRNIEQAMGSGIKRPSPSELENRVAARRSLVAARPIREGELFSEENLGVKRPGSGLSPMRWDDVVGRRAPRNFVSDEQIEL